MILVLVEPGDGSTATLSLEALTFARREAELLGLPVHALVVGPHPSSMLADLADYGVAWVHHADDPRLASYSAAAWAAAVVQAATAGSARLVLAAASPRGNEVMAHVAARTGRRMAANVVTLSGSDPIVAARQVMGGAALEEVALADAPALLTMAGHAVEPLPAASPADTAVSTFAPELTDADLVAQVKRSVPTPAGGSDLAQARVVVGAGRGVGGEGQFGDLLELVDLLGGALGVSRVVTSLGWRPHHEQVGQTGSRISPDIYLACGISGAIQHWAGCSTAKTIIAVNTDAEAPMVTKAHYAVIGDLHEIIPAVNAELRKRMA
jgi:electron transfer flavoprotein alpha subunit